MKNLQRKADAADKMFSQLVACMNDALAIDKTQTYTRKQEVPQWL